MDIATIVVALLAAFGLIFMAISENAPAFVDTASLLIVVAGSIAVVMARCSLGEFLGPWVLWAPFAKDRRPRRADHADC